MQRTLAFLMLFMSFPIFSQVDKKADSTKVSTTTKDTTKLPEEEFFQLLDNDDVELANKLNGHMFVRDSAVYGLFDDPEAARMDAAWQRELYKSSLYNDYRDSLLNQEYNEVVFEDLPTDTLKARLKKLDKKTPLRIQYNPLLENVIKSYLKRNKKAMEELMALSAYYFPLFEQKLNKFNIPLEIKYLAIVESSLNPRARSRVGATGLWQFMYATGRMHGLDVSSYVDERMDPVLATEAAAEYLSTLYRVFQDWDLVLASYNSGPGNVSKAIRRSGGSHDYWKLRPYLPRETAGYVPAFLATMYLFEYAEEHGFQPPNPETVFFETDTLHPKEMLTFDQISQMTGVEKELLQFLNPSYKLDVIPDVEEEAYSLRLPREKVGLFVNNEENIYAYINAKEEEEEEKVETSEERIRYKVVQGDYLGRIAERFGVGVSDIKRWNGLSSNRLRIGQRLTIFSGNGAGEASQESIPSYYTVKRGDSLWSISKKFPGITVQKIKSLNKMSSNRLRPGMKLKLSEG